MLHNIHLLLVLRLTYTLSPWILYFKTTATMRCPPLPPRPLLLTDSVTHPQPTRTPSGDGKNSQRQTRGINNPRTARASCYPVHVRMICCRCYCIAKNTIIWCYAFCMCFTNNYYYKCIHGYQQYIPCDRLWSIYLEGFKLKLFLKPTPVVVVGWKLESTNIVSITPMMYHSQL